MMRMDDEIGIRIEIAMAAGFEQPFARMSHSGIYGKCDRER
jgi:hypothetical protein